MKLNRMIKLILGASTVLAVSSVYAQDGAELAKTKACVGCHSTETKIIGPAFKEIAAKYAEDTDTIVASIKNGSSGKWGPVPMPPNAVNDEEAKALATWIFSLK
ncbi:c-type cytochrome [Pelistega ratti]|nr:c-type cytochrome [Pelistega ratti]